MVKNRKVRLSVVSVLLVVMFFGCAVAIVSQMADINRLKNQEAAYTQQLADQKEENAELEEILDSDDRDAYIEQKALHTIEHICATILRNGSRKDGIIYFGPMGCRTGFYLLTYGIPDGEIKPMLEDCFRQALTFTEIPGSKREECGNYLEHDLDGAKAECRKYLAVLESI